MPEFFLIRSKHPVFYFRYPIFIILSFYQLRNFLQLFGLGVNIPVKISSPKVLFSEPANQRVSNCTSRIRVGFGDHITSGKSVNTGYSTVSGNFALSVLQVKLFLSMLEELRTVELS